MFVIALTSHSFHICLNSLGLERVGYGIFAETGPGARERTTSNKSIDVELCG